MAVAPDGRTVATAGYDGLVKLWDAATGRERLVLGSRFRHARPLAYHPGGALLAGGAQEGVVVWELTTGLPHFAHYDFGNVWSVAFAPDGSVLAVGDSEGRIRLLDTAAGTTVRTLADRHTGDVTAVAFTPDGRTLASASRDHTVKLWHVATGQELVTLRGHHAAVNALTFTPDGRTLATADHAGIVRFWRAGSW